jgi:hypothetical protein
MIYDECCVVFSVAGDGAKNDDATDSMMWIDTAESNNIYHRFEWILG